MRLIGRIIGIFVALLVVVAVGVFYLLQDANRLKPELEQLISENSGYQVKINGDLSWQLFPPLKLNASDLTVQDGERNMRANQLALRMDLSAIWQDINQWRITALQLRDAELADAEGTTNIRLLDLKNFAFNKPAALFADLEYLSKADEVPLQATIDGTVTYAPAGDATPQRITLADTLFTTELAEARCDAQIADASNTPALVADDPEDALLPVALLAAYDLTAQCDVHHLTLNEETFNNGKLELANAGGKLDVLFDQPDFFGGQLRTEALIETSARPLRWRVVPDATNVDSQRFIDWTDQKLQWVAAVALHSTIEMTGNTERELVSSIRARSEFDGGQGQLNIAKIKEQLMRMALLARKGAEVEQWPDVWNYQTFTGNWVMQGKRQQLDFVLDNMEVAATGTYDFFANDLDMLANVTLHEPLADSPFRVNSMLQDTPIPVRCRGVAEDPKCRVDEDAAKRLIANALTSDSDTGLRRKLEQKIDEEVPEEYREAARGLLDLLGRSAK